MSVMQSLGSALLLAVAAGAVLAPGGTIKVLRKLTGALSFAIFKTTIDGLLASPAPAE